VRVGAKRWAQVGPKPNQRRLNQVAEPPGSALRRHVAGLGRCAGRLVPEHHEPAAGRTPAPYAAAARAMINTVRTQDQQALTRTEGRRPLTPTQYSRAALLRSLRRRLQRTAVS
jgi:hypothetical protein